MRNLSVRALIFSVVLLMLPQVSRCATPAPPTFTEQFSIAGKNKVSIALDVNQTGLVKIAVSWQGQPLTIEMKSATGVSVGKLTGQAAPQIELSFTAKDADLKKGSPWGIVISLTNTDGASKADGSFTVTLPAPVLPDLHAKEYKANVDKADAQVKARLDARIQAFEQDKVKARALRLTKIAADRQVNSKKRQDLQTAHKNGLDKELAVSLKTIATDPDTPVITACSLSEGSPNDQVTLTGRNFSVYTVYLEIPGQNPPLVATGAVSTGTTVRFAIPNYTTTDSVKANFYLKGRTAPFPNGKEVISNKVSIWLKPSIPVLAPIKNPGTNDPAGGCPGDAILITGTGMDPNGKVHFILSPTDDREARTENWSEFQVTAFIPDPGAFANPINAQVYVICNGHKSAPQPLVITPEWEVKVFKFWANQNDNTLGNDSDVYSDPLCTTDWLDADYTKFAYTASKYVNEMRATSLTPPKFTQNDILFKTTHLANHWVVDSVEFTPRIAVTHFSDVNLVEYRQGTDSPYVKVSWWAYPIIWDAAIDMYPGKDAGQVIFGGVQYAPISYELHMMVKGPRGTSFW